jgi:hypothetical protein
VLNDLDSIDWSSMGHAYGPASEVPGWLRDMAAADPGVRRAAFDDFYGAAHHQGDVYACTTASLPFPNWPALAAAAASAASPTTRSCSGLVEPSWRVCVDYELR